MKHLIRNSPASTQEMQDFLNSSIIETPDWLVSFFLESNGAVISGETEYFEIWTLSELRELNEAYHVDEFANNFFLIGTDGGGQALAIEKNSGMLYSLPFIGMSNESAVFVSKSLASFIE